MTRKTVPIGERDIQSLTGAFTSSLDPKTILTSVAERTSQLLNATRCSVVRVDPERHPGKAFVFSSIDDSTIEGYELDLEDYPEIEYALDQNLPILVRDEPDDKIAVRIRKLRRKVPFPVSLAIPLTYQAESFGVLFLRFADAGVDISREAITFCQLIAFGAAVSLHNAQELQSVMAEVHQRENYAQQLADANQLRMETLSAASHDLRIPLNSIIGYTDLLTEGAYGEMPPEQKQVLGHVNDNAQALLQIVNTLIDYARLEEGKVPVQVSDGEVPRLVDDLRLTLDPFLHNRSVELDFQIVGKPTLFRTDWGEAQAGPHQPAAQCHQVHRARNRLARGPAGRKERHLRGPGYGHRNRSRAPARHLRPVAADQPGRCRRSRRPGALDRQAVYRHDRGQDRGHEQARGGDDFPSPDPSGVPGRARGMIDWPNWPFGIYEPGR